jgi:hypothetical protein
LNFFEKRIAILSKSIIAINKPSFLFANPTAFSRSDVPSPCTLKHLKPIENFEQKKREEENKIKQIEEIEKRAANIHNIKEQPVNPNQTN